MKKKKRAAEFFEARAGKATGRGLMKFLRGAPRVRPEAEYQRPAQEKQPPALLPLKTKRKIELED
jgi:hypothetical protein